MRTCLCKRVNVHLSSRGASGVGGVVLTASRRKMCGGWGGMIRAPADEARKKREERAVRALMGCIVEEEACFFLFFSLVYYIVLS